ncbi:excinuclease ABC subunit UvrC [Candidatus Uhrbacteria bacterium]|nr:excinuclease ABC subunit UvrC [Candidatus Uhrbacteria bacterium]
MSIPKLSNLPQHPGCYLFKNTGGQIIYIGKAKSLKKRVSSYFQKNGHDPKTAELVTHITDLDFIVTDNELEALLLESRLIKLHRPQYNIDLKDSQKYAYLKLTNEDFPRLLTTRAPEKDGAAYFGPYQDGNTRELTAKVARQVFKIRTCGDKLPNHPCIQYYIHRCDAPCIKNISKEKYQENIEKAELFLKGKTREVIKGIETEMKVLATKQQFEKAKECRDQVEALLRLGQTQKVMLLKDYNEHFLNFIDFGELTVLQLFEAEKGAIKAKHEFRFKHDPEFFENFITQYYSSNEIPDQLIIPLQLENKSVLEQYLTKLKGKVVQLITPERGKKLELLEMVKNNILMSIRQENPALTELKQKLYLSSVPNVIECFDISNIQDKWVVGSMVQFRGGEPDKNNYRRFKIRQVQGQDDFASMAEIVFRRYSRLSQENQPLPDLIVIDGGKGQLNAAFRQLQKLNLKIPIISLAKKFEEIYTISTERPLLLSRKDLALRLLQRIRDEAHGFAVKYHTLLRSKSVLE